MLNDFLTYITEQSLFQKDDRILLAISGGIDSVVLAHQFHEAKLNFDIAHCNFKLRKEADDDAVFVNQLAEKYGVVSHSKIFNTDQYASDHNVSIQMAARLLRYTWFEDLLKKHSHKYICTAHHHSDSIETILFNLSKGTGVSGVRGIKPKNGNIVRPLLFASKKEIVQYAKTNQLDWREDISNLSEKYHRNYIRHKILPEFEHINPSFEKTTKTTIDRLMDAEEIVLDVVEEAKRSHYHSEGENQYFDLDCLRQKRGCATILHRLIKGYGFNYNQSQDILKRSLDTGKIFLSGSHRANIDRDQLIIAPLSPSKPEKLYTIEKDQKSITLKNITLSIEECKVPKIIPNNVNVGLFDSSKVSYPLTIRNWKKGDKFYPLGMTQQKKISDLLIDTKIPLFSKDKVKVICSDEQIIWVVGHRIDNRFKITADTNEVLKISVKST